MAQDTRKALDEKTRKLIGGKVEEGKEHAAYQESQQQLLAIQAEQQQNLAVARAESKASFDNNQTLAQAAELGAISAAEAEQAAAMGAQAGAQLNPATQQILSKYGAGQPRFSRSQSHSQQVTKQNITINNNITSNTTNDVKVPSNIGGPLQGRPLQFKDPAAAGGGSVGKFKNWISAAFARQNEEGAKRDREYRHRESSLTKSANRMMKKLEDIGKTIGTRMDPRKIGSTWQSQLKTLLFLFGFGYLTSNWSKILAGVAKIEEWVRGTWDYFTGDIKEGKRTFISDIKSFLGAKEGESVFDAIKELFIGKDGFLGLLKDYLSGLAEDRAKAMKMVKFPEIDLGDLVGTIKSLGLYLGDLLSAMVSGSSGVKSSIERNIKDISNKGAFEQAGKDSKTMSTERFKTTSGKEVDADVGIGAILNNEYKGLTRHSLDSEGNLTNKYGAESTVAQASDISRLFLQANTGGKIDATQLSAGLSRLMRASQNSMSANNTGIPVQASFLKKWFTKKELSDMLKSGELKNQMYYMVLRKKTDEDNLLENTDLTNTFVKEYTEKKLGNLARKATGNEDSFLGNLYGGYQYVKGALHLGETAYNKISDNDYRVEYVKQPRDGDEVIDDGSGKARKVNFVEITPDVIQKIADKITGKEGTNIDIKDRTFVTDVQRGLVSSAKVSLDEDIKEREEYRKSHLTDFNNNRMLISLRNRRAELSTTDAAKIDYNLEEAYNEYDNLVKSEEERDKNFKNKYNTSRVAEVFGGRFDVEGDDINNYLKTAPITKQKDNHGAAGMAKRYDSKNPGNYKGTMFSNGQRDSFSKGKGRDHAKFNTWEEGYAGNVWQLLLYLTGKSSHTDKNPTLRKVVRTWVGPHVTEEHLKDYSRDSGLPLDSPLKANADTLYRLALTLGKWDSSHKVNSEAKTGVAMALNEWKKKGYRTDDDSGNFYSVSMPSTSYSTGSNESNTSFASSNSAEKPEEKKEAKSFLEIFKEKITDLLTNFGGTVGTINEAISPVADELKSKIFKNGYVYKGPITKEFTDYETYLANQDKLPEELPKGLSSTEWENRIYDLTGSFPHYQKLKDRVVDKNNLRDDSKEILSKYTKDENKIEINDESLIKYLNDPSYRESLTAEDKARFEKELGGTTTVNPTLELSDLKIEGDKPNKYLSLFDTKTYEKKKDGISTIAEYIPKIDAKLESICNIESASGMATAKVVDAVNQNTAVSANSSRNLAKATQVQQKNRVESLPSLSNKSLTGIT
jgi:hypothetical protein